MNLTIITKNHAADPEIGFLAKSISKSNGFATAMPIAWELIINKDVFDDDLFRKQYSTLFSMQNTVP